MPRRSGATCWVHALALVGIAVACATLLAQVPPQARPRDGDQARQQAAVQAEMLPPRDAPGSLPAPRKLDAEIVPAQPPAASAGLGPATATAIDLPAALRLAGLENPQILIARQRVVEAVARQQIAAANILPTASAGLNYDDHTGPLQQSSGNILKVDRSALYLGAGANAVAAGTVNIPGVVYNLNVSEALYGALIAKQGVNRARFASLAARNDAFRAVATAYAELLRTQGHRSIAVQTRVESAAVARLTAIFARAGQTAPADAERAANELTRRNTDLVQTESEILTASARLAELLALDRSTRLLAVEDHIVPTPVVPDPIPLKELLAIALLQRPELGEKQAAVRQAMLALDGAKLLPFSPNVILGFSSGTFGGGSNLVSSPTPVFSAAGNQPTFGNFGQRNDFDAVAYWTAQNLGVGNVALIRGAGSRLQIAELEKLEVFNRVRREVANAYVLTHARFGQLQRAAQAVEAGQDAYLEDFRRIQGGVGRPIELLESLRLLGLARYDYLNAIVDYNEAQIDLYVALGQPPADMLARPVPTDFQRADRPLGKGSRLAEQGGAKLP